MEKRFDSLCDFAGVVLILDPPEVCEGIDHDQSDVMALHELDDLREYGGVRFAGADMDIQIIEGVRPQIVQPKLNVCLAFLDRKDEHPSFMALPTKKRESLGNLYNEFIDQGGFTFFGLPCHEDETALGQIVVKDPTYLLRG